MPSVRASLTSLLIVIATVVVAMIGALAADRVGLSSPIVPGIAAAIVTATFVYAMPEGLVAFAIFALLADTFALWLGLDLLLFDETAILLLVLAALAFRRIAFERVRIGWVEGALLLLVAVGVVSSLVNDVPVIVWGSGLLLLVKGIVFFYLVRLLPFSVDDAARMGITVVIVGCAIGVLGLVEWLDPIAFRTALSLPLAEQQRADVTVIRSIFLHPALYGWLTAFIGLIFYALVFARRAWWPVPLALLMNAGTVLSGRRTPMLGVVAALGVAAVWASVRLGLRRALLWVWLPLTACVVVAVMALAPWISSTLAQTRLEYGWSFGAAPELFAEDPRADVVTAIHPRVALYTGSVVIARDHFPLGVGLGRFGSHLSRDHYSPVYEQYGLNAVRLLGPDNPQAATDAYWPMILGETGALGLLAALVLYGAIGLGLMRRAAMSTPGIREVVALAALLAFTEAIVRSLTSSVFVAPPIAYFVFGIVGVAYALSAVGEGVGSERRQLDDAGIGDAVGGADSRDHVVPERIVN